MGVLSYHYVHFFKESAGIQFNFLTSFNLDNVVPFLQVAIKGKSFVKASEIATELIMSNILRIGKVNVIGDVILFFGKLCVSHI